MSVTYTCAVLGCGQMGSALVKGTLGGKTLFRFFTYTPSQTRARALAREVGGQFFPDLASLPACDLYLVGCKPQQWGELSLNLKGKIPAGSLVVSIMAGTSLKTIQNSLDGHLHVVRAMPNLASLVKKGVTLLAFSEGVGSQHEHLAMALFQESGKVFVLEEEEDINFLTGITGSGPAFLFEMARIFMEEMMARNGRNMNEKTAREMVAQTFLGAGEIMNQDQDQKKKTFAEWRDMVTSKKGVTEMALGVLKEGDFSGLLGKALKAAHKRAVELGG